MMGFTNDKENFTIVDDKAYTEDNVLVYNVFMYNIPKQITEDQVLKYFEKFGEVLKLRLLADKKPSRRNSARVGFVNFADPKVAAKVLKKGTHTLKSKRITVRACDSWHQPDVQKAARSAPVATTTTTTNTTNTTTTNSDTGRCTEAGGGGQILQLNDDCLEHICKKLEIRDQVSFARTCSRFRNVFVILSKVEYKVLMLEKLESLTLWEIREFLKMVGPNIETLIGSIPFKDCKRIVEFVGIYCKNIKSVNIYLSKLKGPLLGKLLQKMKSVTELELHDVSLRDNSILIFKNMPNLKILRVPENYELTGKYLNQLESLQELSLSGCGNIQPSHLIETCKSLKHLQILDIQRCERLSTNAFQEIAKYCTELEELKISCSFAKYEYVTRLPKLKRLQLLSFSPFTAMRQEFFTELAKHQTNQLESLKFVVRNCINHERASLISKLKQLKQLRCANNAHLDDRCLEEFCNLSNLEEISLKNCQSFSKEGLLGLLRRCVKLQRVNIVRCKQITDAFVHEAITLLKQQHQQQLRKEPVIFLVTKTGINDYIINTSEYLMNASYIELSFNMPFALCSTDFRYDLDDEQFDFSNDEDDDDDDDFDADDLYMVAGIYDDDGDYLYVVDTDGEDDDIDYNEAYDLFGLYPPYGDDINDIIW